MLEKFIFFILVLMLTVNSLFWVNVIDRFDALEEKFCIHYDAKHSMYVDN